MNQAYSAVSRLPEPAVTGKATRRKFSAEYKLRILAEAEASTERVADRSTAAAGRAIRVDVGQVAQAAGAGDAGRAEAWAEGGCAGAGVAAVAAGE
jgi:transposase-like protein